MYTLVVVDMQPGFLKRFEDYKNDEVKNEVIKGCQLAVIEAIADGAEIIDLNYDNRHGELGPTIPEIADLWKGYKKLFKKRVSYVEKGRDGGGEELHRNGIAENEIRVCGINAGACVKETVIELALNFGHDVSVISSAVGNAWTDSCEQDLDHMEMYAVIE